MEYKGIKKRYKGIKREYNDIKTLNKFNKIILVVFKIFLNNIKYSDYRYTRFRINYKSKFNN